MHTKKLHNKHEKDLIHNYRSHSRTTLFFPVLHHLLFNTKYKNSVNGGGGDWHTEFSCGNPKKGDLLEDLHIVWMITLKQMLR